MAGDGRRRGGGDARRRAGPVTAGGVAPGGAGLPHGFGLCLDPQLSFIRPDLVFGGSPPRFLQLSAAGRVALDELRRYGVGSPAAGVLARRLTDVGMAHPRPPALTVSPDVTVVIPVRDRAEQLAGLLAALGGDFPVVVVDDGSIDGEALVDVCARHGARLERRQINGGPGAARNDGWRLTTTTLTAFVDSDCRPDPGWIELLAAHFVDPTVAAVAPRIVSSTVVGARTGIRSRYAAGRCPLDMGRRPGRVEAGTRISYTPSAALMVRRQALVDIDGFDEALRYGEDVDLVWRLGGAGWRVRYDPSLSVAHDDPVTWRGILERRLRYGTSAAPLTRRHPGSVSPLVLQPWPTLSVVALLARRPAVAVAAYGIGVGVLMRRLRSLQVPPARPLSSAGTAVGQTWLGIGRWCNQFAWPGLLVALVYPGGRDRHTRMGRRLALASLLGGPPVAEWCRRRPSLDPVTFAAAYLADEAAYGAGVYRGCVAHHRWTPLLPTVPLRRIRWLRRPKGTPGLPTGRRGFARG